MGTPSFRRAALGLLAVPLAAVASAQAGAQEFIRQSLMVAAFKPIGDAGTARKVADELRSRIARASNKREVGVVDDYDVEKEMLSAGFTTYESGSYLSDGEVRALARKLRVDEVVIGSVSAVKGQQIVVTAELVLMRDWRSRQPFPVVRGATAALAAEVLSREIVRARGQMAGVRRCENSARAADWPTATREAELAVKAYEGGTLARTCLLAVLVETGVPADSVRRVAEEVLKRDTLNIFAAVTRARAYDAEKKPADAAASWVRVVDLRPDSLELGLTAVEELIRLQRHTQALGAARHLLTRNAKEPRARRLQFRADFALSRWKDAASLGDSLAHEDSVFRADSNYTARFVEALKQSGDTLGALATSVQAVKDHPGDSRLYTQYLQILTAENVAALPRGLARFPEVSELYVLSARSARGAGKRKEAIAATANAIKHDPQFLQGYLQLADLWFEEQRPDSALAWLARAPRTGLGSEMLRTYAIGRGGQLLRAAPDTEPTLQLRAIAFLQLADSVDSREDTRGYVAGATLQLARAELVLASKSRGCADARRADDALSTSSSALERGVGDGAQGDQLKQVFESMRSAVDNAVKVLCKT